MALILVYSGGSGAGFLLAKGFFDTVPKALDEAAYLDGATRFQVFTKVTIPLSKPIIVYTTLSAFLGPWLDFIFAKVICRANAKYYTVALGLWKMLEKGESIALTLKNLPVYERCIKVYEGGDQPFLRRDLLVGILGRKRPCTK